MVVFDVSKSFQQQLQHIEHWLNYLAQRALSENRNVHKKSDNKYKIILVGTKIDKLSPNQQLIQPKILQNYILDAIHNKYRLPMEENIIFVSGINNHNIDTLKNRLDEIISTIGEDEMEIYVRKEWLDYDKQVKQLQRENNLPIFSDFDTFVDILKKNIQIITTQSSDNKPPEWIPDKDQKSCFKCRKEFTFLIRKHICRNCGNIFCDSCSSNFITLPHFSILEEVRTCDKCVSIISGAKMEPIIQYLHAIGRIVISPTKIVCSKPSLLSKLMAPFISKNLTHLNSILNDQDLINQLSTTFKHSSILPFLFCEQLIRNVIETLEDQYVDIIQPKKVLEFFQSIGFCFFLQSNQSILYGQNNDNNNILFPNLRPSSELFLFQPSHFHQNNNNNNENEKFSTSAYYMIRKQENINPSISISSETFCRIEALLYRYHDPDYKLFNNGVMLKHNDERGILFLTKDINIHNYDRDSVKYTYVVVLYIYSNKKSSPKLLDKIRSVVNGMNIEIYNLEKDTYEELTRRYHKLWDPIDGSRFYKQQSNEWECLSQSKIEEFELNLPNEQEINKLQFTELTPEEKNPSRRREYERIKRYFYESVGDYQSSHYIELTKVVVLQNQELEDQFFNFYQQKCFEGLQINKEELKEEEYNEVQKKTLEMLQQHQRNILGAEQINLHLAYHANHEKYYYSNAIVGVHIPPKLTNDQVQEIKDFHEQKDIDPYIRLQIDHGWFGRGFYMTNNPTYCLGYNEMKKITLLKDILKENKVKLPDKIKYGNSSDWINYLNNNHPEIDISSVDKEWPISLSMMIN